MDYEYLGGQIRMRRMSRRLTQGELAKRLGISASFLGHVERGSRKASLETMVKICRALDASMDDLLFPRRGRIAEIEREE